MSKKLIVIDFEGNQAPNVDAIELDETKPEMLLLFPEGQTEDSIRCIFISNTLTNALNAAILENFEFAAYDDVDEDDDPTIAYTANCCVGRDPEESIYRVKANVFHYGKKKVYHGRVKLIEE